MVDCTNIKNGNKNVLIFYVIQDWCICHDYRDWQQDNLCRIARL